MGVAAWRLRGGTASRTELVGRHSTVAVVARLVERVADTGAHSGDRGLADAQLHRDRVGCLEPDAASVWASGRVVLGAYVAAYGSAPGNRIRMEARGTRVGYLETGFWVRAGSGGRPGVASANRAGTRWVDEECVAGRGLRPARPDARCVAGAAFGAGPGGKRLAACSAGCVGAPVAPVAVSSVEACGSAPGAERSGGLRRPPLRGELQGLSGDFGGPRLERVGGCCSAPAWRRAGA